MFTEVQILAYATEQKINVTQAERDMYLTCLLLLFSKYTITSKLAFKGGTCLSKIHWDRWRISQDLDFTIRPAYRNIDIYNELLHKFTWPDKTERQLGGTTFGILASSDNRVNENTCEITFYYERHKDVPLGIRCQISFRDDIIYDGLSFEFAKKSYFNTIIDKMGGYYSFPKFKCLHKYEVLAEKLRAVFQRVGERDLFDTVYFARKDPEISASHELQNLIRKMFVLKMWKEKEFFTWDRMVDAVETISQTWLTCKECIPDDIWGSIPPIDKVKKEFLDSYKFLKKLTTEEKYLLDDVEKQSRLKLYKKMCDEVVKKLKTKYT